jgi:RNA polymerase sigma factor (TIGR02999 family)
MFRVKAAAKLLPEEPMPPDPTPSVTVLLREWRGGDRTALDRLMRLVYDELRRLAKSYLRREREGHTLQSTALVNEAYLRLVEQAGADWQSRAHFFGVAAQLMRQILVDHARERRAAKRGGGEERLALDEAMEVPHRRPVDLLALDDALNDLAKFDPRQAHIVELRYFGGLEIDETAEVLGISASTVKREWNLAKAWLYGQLNRG